MFSLPIELSVGEAYILNDFDIEGDIFSVFSLMDLIAARALSVRDVLELGLGLLALPASNAERLQGRGSAGTTWHDPFP